MSRLDRLLMMRIGTRVLAVVLGFLALLILIELADRARFNAISNAAGPQYAWLVVATAATKWAVRTLPVTVLIGTVVGILSLQRHRELVVMKASGHSIWRLISGPALLILLFGIVITLAIEAGSTTINRQFNPSRPVDSVGTKDYWFSQNGENGRYSIVALSANSEGTVLRDVRLFAHWEGEPRRIIADEAGYSPGNWVFRNALVFDSDGASERISEYSVPTNNSGADLRLLVGSSEDFTFYELVNVLEAGITDRGVFAVVTTRLLKLLSLPVLLVGSLLIAFAFTSGYRRTNNYGLTIVYAIILGFVVFVIVELAERAGLAGALDPLYATWGPAVISVLIGLSILMYKEDGRA